MKPLQPLPPKPPVKSAIDEYNALGVEQISDIQFLRTVGHIVAGDSIIEACKKVGVKFQSFKLFETANKNAKSLVTNAKRIRAERLSEYEQTILRDTLKDIEKEKDVATKIMMMNKISKCIDKIQERDNHQSLMQYKMVEMTQNMKQKEMDDKTSKANKPLVINLNMDSGKDFAMDETRVDDEGSDPKDQYVQITEL